MSAPCPTCFPVTCDVADDTNLYNFQQSAFPFVFFCPSGYNCNAATSFNMVCCGQFLSVQFPAGSTASDKTNLIQLLVNQCNSLLNLCGQKPTTMLFYNRQTSCQAPCPDGTIFTFTVPAGTFAAFDQATADQEAQDYACQQAVLRRLCLGNIAPCGCVGSPFNSQIPTNGGNGPFQFSQTGSFPAGLSLSASGVIAGTPTLAGFYSFSVTALTADGGSVTKPYTVSILQIVTSQLPTFTIGVPYSFQLTAAGGSGNYLWRLAAGTLPNGLTLSNTGLISGTPV